MEAKIIYLSQYKQSSAAQGTTENLAARMRTSAEQIISDHYKSISEWQERIKVPEKLIQNQSQELDGELIKMYKKQIHWHKEQINWWEKDKARWNHGSDLICTWKRKMN